MSSTDISTWAKNRMAVLRDAQAVAEVKALRAEVKRMSINLTVDPVEGRGSKK